MPTWVQHWMQMLVLAIVSLAASSCAFTDIPLELPKRGLEDSIRGGKGRQVVVFVPFADERAMKRCGMQKNGYNMDTADAICDIDPSLWIAELLADELRASGFTVLVDTTDHRPSALQINGTLLKLFAEPVLGAWTGSLETDLSVRLRATSDTGLEADRKFFMKAWKGGMMASTMQPYHTSLHRATQALLEEMVRAIIELMDRHPQLGSNDSPLRITPALRSRS